MRQLICRRIAGMSFVALLLSACGANYNSIYRYQYIPATESAVISVDAKQRLLLSSQSPVSTSVTGAVPGEDKLTVHESVRRFCAEPSPDVFSVVAQALSGGGTFGKTADPAALQVALNAAFSSAEQGSSIQRTQTINMLRELMYRTCERYLSGGISDLELPLQAIRDQRLMVSILAIEQLTGAITTRPVIIGAQGDATAGSSGADAVVRIDDARKELVAKNSELKKRQDDYDKLNGDGKDCDSIATAVKDKKDDSLNAALKAKKESCETASSTLLTAKKEQSDASTHYTNMVSVKQESGIPAGAKTAISTAQGSGGLEQANSESIASVTSAVKEIVNLNFQQDEFLFLCLKVLAPLGRENKGILTSEVQGTCIEYVKSGIDKQTKLNLEAVRQVEIRLNADADVLFENFWEKIKKDSKTVDAEKLGKALKIVTEPEKKQCFAGAAVADKEAYRTCFRTLRRPLQSKLAAKE